MAAALFEPAATVDSVAPSTVILRCNRESQIPPGRFGTPSFNVSQIVALRANGLDAHHG